MWNFIIPAAATLIAGRNASKAAQSAANTQAEAADRATELQREMFDLTREDQRPYREAGYDALTRIKNLLANPGGITSDPGYEFGMREGTRALNSGAAARGMTYSGAAAKALTRYGQDYAGSKLDQTYNRLASVAGLGQVGANEQNNMNFARSAGDNILGAANAQAGAGMYRSSVYGNTLNQLGAIGARYAQGANPMTINPQYGLPNYAIDPYGGP